MAGGFQVFVAVPLDIMAFAGDVGGVAAGLAFSADLDAAMVRGHVGIPGGLGFALRLPGVRRGGGFVTAGEVAGVSGVLSWAPRRGARGFPKNVAQRGDEETTKCAFDPVATAARRGRWAKPGIPTRLWRKTTRCVVQFPPGSGYAAVATAVRGR